jgi:hypothetical protein
VRGADGGEGRVESKGEEGRENLRVSRLKYEALQPSGLQ